MDTGAHTRIPAVAIVGRPNVGKSSIFNAILGRRVSIVDERAGVTRDRVSADVEFDGRLIELVDTGGIGIVDSDELEADVELQITVAIERADLVLFVVDARDGLTSCDETVSLRLREAGKDVLLVANKCDTGRQELATSDFFRLGIGEPVMTVATERRGCKDLLEAVRDRLQLLPVATADRKPLMKVAFVGRRNVGKSTLVNTLAGEDRVIVSEVPGTTRDAVDVLFDYKGTRFLAIDTAGMRKKRQVKDNIEFYSVTRSIQAIQRADVVVHMMDAPSDISTVDKKLAETIQEQYKPCLITLNKMDLVSEIARTEFIKYIRDTLPWLDYAPIAMISARTGDNIDYMVEAMSLLYEQSKVRVQTAQLNEVFEVALKKRHPPRQGTHFTKIYYATQVETQPPTIALFVNFPKCFDDSYLRYLMHELQSKLPFSRVPLKFLVRGRRRERTRSGR